MKLVIGLGNPGIKYQNTRHSVGYYIVDQIPANPELILKKTTVFMNSSGQDVKKFLKQANLTPTDLIIIHDDWAFEVGDFRYQKNRGANHHKGVENIIETLGTKDFWRVRIGISSPEAGTISKDYVLGKFSLKERERIDEMVSKIGDVLKSLISV
jgi:peptidyl-tRNA hydrolase, PTH1 family